MSITWTDIPLNASTFALEIKGLTIVSVGSIEGLQIENEVANFAQQSAKGMSNQVVTLGKVKYPGELTVKRLAPKDMGQDPLWKWMNEIRSKGSLSGERKDGSVVIYDFKGTEQSRWNFFAGWVSKISQDGVDATKNELIHETITIQYDKLERHS